MVRSKWFSVIGQRKEVFLTPLFIRLSIADHFFDFSIVKVFSFHGINGHYSTWTEPSFLNDFRLIKLNYSSLTAHDNNTIVVFNVTRRPQTISIKGCTNKSSVCKNYSSRTIPRLTNTAVVFIKSSQFTFYLGIFLPCFRNEHEYGLENVSSTQFQ